MKSLWNDAVAIQCGNDPLKLRVYTSQLLGKEPALVLHGGGNTSVKTTIINLFGEKQDVLCVKGSGWDLASIEVEGFPAVLLASLIKLATLDQLSDSEMVREQRAAMLDPGGPNPSVEAILHALIPYQYVDHTHADAVVTITNTAGGEQRIREIYGDRVLIVPYVMPGFILAKKIDELTKNLDWQSIEGIILLNHGIFSFANDAKTSYERMINLVSQAESYLTTHIPTRYIENDRASTINLQLLATIRKQVSRVRGQPVVIITNTDAKARHFAKLANVGDIASRGPLTPDHVIRTKRIPLIIDNDAVDTCVHSYAESYQHYFTRHTDGTLTCLDLAPRWAVWPDQGIMSFSDNLSEAKIISDICNHTIDAIQNAEQLGGWCALPEKDIFDLEYWELEQAKLNKQKSSLEHQGKVVLITGAASGIGKACVQQFLLQGAVVIALDIADSILSCFPQDRVLAIKCDVTDKAALISSVESGVKRFGGIDVLICNAGIFPASESLDSLRDDTWQRSLDCNLTSHQRLLTIALPFLKQGIDPSVIFIASKNVPAPGPGAAAYSVAKAGLTQLARVAALELAQWQIRVNVIHPNAVFDTAIWTNDVLQKRAKHYNMTVEQYKTSNLLGVEVKSDDVAKLSCTMAGSVFSKTTGAQVAIDGGNERVI